MQWTVTFINSVAEGEVENLPSDMRAVLVRIVWLIEEFGLESVGMPYVRPVRGKLWEIRLKGREGIARSLYITAAGRRVVILRTFAKKTQQTPSEEITLALQRAKEMKI